MPAMLHVISQRGKISRNDQGVLKALATYLWGYVLVALLLSAVLTQASGEEISPAPVIVTTGNQSAFIQADGTFRVRNVPMFATWGVFPEGGLFPGPTMMHRLVARGSEAEIAASQRFELNLPIGGILSGVQLSPLFSIYGDSIRLRMEVSESLFTVSPSVIRTIRVFATFSDGTEQEVTEFSTFNSTSRYLLFERGQPSVRALPHFPGGISNATIFARFDGLLASAPVVIRQFWPSPTDTDGDGMPNIWEISYGLNPNDASDAHQDVDNDGLSNLSEYLAGTNPRQPDTDFDGLLDGNDDNPLVPESAPPLLVVHRPLGGAIIDLNQAVVSVNVSASDNAMLRSITTVLGSHIHVTPVNATSVDALNIPIPVTNLGLTTAQVLPLQVVATDYAGNFTVIRRNLHFQATPPAISFVSPGAGATYVPENDIAIHIQASDEHGVSGVELRVDDTVIAASSGGELQATYMVPSGRTGPLHFDAIAVDLLGNVATVRRTLQPDVATDDQGPQLDISHASGATLLVGSETVITVFADDPAGVASVDLQVSHGELTPVSGSVSQWIFLAPDEPSAIAVTMSAVDTLGNSTQQQLSWNAVVADDLFELVSPGPEDSIYELTRTVLVFNVPGYLNHDWGDLIVDVNGLRYSGNFSSLNVQGRRTYTCNILPGRGTKFLRIMAVHNREGDEPRLVQFTRRVLPWKPVRLHGTIISPLRPLDSAAISVGEQTAPVGLDGSFSIDLTVPSPTGRFDVTAALLTPGEYLHAGSLTYYTEPGDCARGEATLPRAINLSRIPDALIGQTEYAELATRGFDSEGNPYTRVHALYGQIIAFSAEADFVDSPVFGANDVFDVVRRLKESIDVDYLSPFDFPTDSFSPSASAVKMNGREEVQLTWLSEGPKWLGDIRALQVFVDKDREIQVFHRGYLRWNRIYADGLIRWHGRSQGDGWHGIITDGYQIAAKNHGESYRQDEETGEIIYRAAVYNEFGIQVVGEGVQLEEHDYATVYEVHPQYWHHYNAYFSFSHLDSPGQLLGRILRDGEPIPNATVRRVDSESIVQTDVNGYFRMNDFGNTYSPREYTVFYVSQSAVDSGDGLSWDTAFRTIEEALALTTSWWVNYEIWIAAGVYLPANLLDPSDPRSATFRIPARVDLYGGFEGIEKNRSDADPAKWKTVLSGDFGVPGDTSENCYRVVTALGYINLSGLTITGGSGRSGAGLSLSSGGSLVDCIIVGNDAGQEAGGGIFMNAYSESLSLQRCVFADNAAASGSAVYYRGRGFSATSCVFVGTGGRADEVIIDAETNLANQLMGLDFNGCTFSLVWPARMRVESGDRRPPQFFGCVWSVSNGSPEVAFMEGNGQFQHCIVPIAISSEFDGGTNRIAQPNFRDVNHPAGPDQTWGTEDDGLFLLPESPGSDHIRVYNFSLPSDLLGNLRTGGVAPDAGAYETAPLRIEDGYVVPSYGNSVEGKTVHVELEITGPDGAQSTVPVVIFPNQLNVLRPIELPLPIGISMRWPNAPSLAPKGDQ